MAVGVSRSHPMVDRVVGDDLETTSDRPVVALTALRADLLLAAARARRRVRLLTPATSRLTDPMRDALVSAGGSWIVREGGATWDGLLGVEDGAEPARLSPSLRPIAADAVQVIVSASLRHRAEAGTRFGPALDAVARWGGAGAAGWGPHEPVEQEWDPEALTAHLAARAPGEARALVAGPTIVGSTLARRTDKGVEEVMQALVAVGPIGAAAAEATVERVPAALADLAEEALPLFAAVFARPGRGDLTTAPFLSAPPAPVALLIGAPGVRDLGLDVPDLRSRFGAFPIGRPRIPGVVVPFVGREGGWPAFERFVEHVGRDRIRAAVGWTPARTPEEG